jgi:nucleoside-diphosphate-sugar epimerase/glycosyltransferase involved in cell wall biosynthesis
MKKILITGANSYIGTSFEKYMAQFGAEYQIDTVDMIGDAWKSKDFSEYDTVFHVAGIAHSDNGKISKEKEKLYYAVNTDLTIETAKKAKAEGVKQFIFMSSAIVYGNSAPIGKGKRITKDTPVRPANCYGDSKVQAENGLRPLNDENFKVVILRPPMIYGKGSKGNYPLMSKMAQKLPIFPYVKNRRSMLYIENLCEFIRLMIVNSEQGTFWPQNKEYSNTSEMVKMIGAAHGKNVHLIHGFEWALKILGLFTGLVDKAFGNLYYDKSLSRYKQNYRIADLKKSIRLTENKSNSKNKKVLFLVNHDVVIYNFRLEIVERLISDGYEVHISSPYGERIDDLTALGAKFHEINMDRHGMNPINELKLLKEYKKLLNEIKPDVILGFTIKPNIYGAIAAKKNSIPFVANITGLGTAVENGGWKQKIFVLLYKYAFTKVQTVFFQNTENRQFFIDNKIAIGKHKLLPGSGVNLDRFPVREYPDDKNGAVKFAFISRIMKEKGIDYYLAAAKEIKKKYPSAEFHICGFCEAEYEGKLSEYNDNGTVIYHGMIRDVAEFLNDIHCVVHPTYYPEGISNVLLEASASGRPIITTDRAGCREVVDDGVNGYMIPCQDGKKLIEAVDKFMKLSIDERKAMGMNGRCKVEKEFNRQIVVKKYVDEVETV